MSKAIVLLSGGIDSAACLAWASQRYDQIIAISFQYHNRPFRERLAVLRLLRHFPARLIETPLPFLMEASDFNPEFADHVPEGYVSNRNLIFYSIAAHFSELHGCESIVGGHTAEDQEAFSDAGATFLNRLESLINQALLTRKVTIELPLSQWTKLDVLRKAAEWKVPFECTWSCYWDVAGPCRKCISCKERAEAFKALGLQDPLCMT